MKVIRFINPIGSVLSKRLYSSQVELQESQINNEVTQHSKALTNPDYFHVHDLFTVKDLFDARVHYGHKLGSLDDRMKPFLYGHRLGHTIFDLDMTANYLRHALNFAAQIAYKDGIILFLMRNPQYTHLVERTARECNEFAHTRDWRGGAFTNSTKQFGAVTRLPDLCIFFSSLNTVLMQHMAVRDSAKMAIPTIAVCDSNCNPNLVTYPVPGNDDSPDAIELYCRIFKEAILRGKEKRKQDFHSQSF